MATKKDFEATARILKTKRTQATSIYAGDERKLSSIELVIDEIAKDFAAVYATDNRLFDRDRFLAACGVK